MNHQQLAQWCADAYLDRHPETWQPIAEGEYIQAYFCADVSTLLFIGSNDDLDWSRDLDRRQDNGIHAGFKLAWLSIMNEVVAEVEKERELTIIGHSLGGALAQLAAMRLNFQTREVVTFGAPRVYSVKFAEVYGMLTEDIRQTRYVFVDDPVPWFPNFGHTLPLWPVCPYRHATPATYLKWWPTSWRSCERHSIQRYVNALAG